MGIVAKKILNSEITGPGVLAWCVFVGRVSNGTASLSGSGNVSSVERINAGEYEINFTNPLPDFPNSANARYGIFVDSTGYHAFVNHLGNNNSTKATVEFRTPANAKTDPDYGYVLVVGNQNTNKFDIKAWCNFDSVGTNNTFTTQRGAGLSACERKGNAGTYELTFDAPLSSANYSIITNSGRYVSRIDSDTLPGGSNFRVEFYDGSETLVSPIYPSVVVVGPKGTLGDPLYPAGRVRAWAVFNTVPISQADCNILAEYNVSSVIRTATTGVYAVNFRTPMRYHPLGSSYNYEYAALVNSFDTSNPRGTAGGIFAQTTTTSLSVDFFTLQATPVRNDPTRVYVCVIQ